jgi:hypothetical protein
MSAFAMPDGTMLDGVSVITSIPFRLIDLSRAGAGARSGRRPWNRTPPAPA